MFQNAGHIKHKWYLSKNWNFQFSQQTWFGWIYYYKKQFEKDNINRAVLTSSNVTNGNLPKAYGLPKIHKHNIPLRIIVNIDSPPFFNIANKNINTLRSFIKPNQVDNIIPKDRNIKLLLNIGNKTCSVYQIQYNDCEASYLGQTKTNLLTRFKEYKQNFTSTSNKPTVILKHCLESSHSFNFDNTKILIHIKANDNSINHRLDTENLFVQVSDPGHGSA